MSIYKGTFTETALQNIRVMIEKIRFDDRVSLQYKPQADLLVPVHANANPDVNVVLNSKGKMKDLVAEVEWINACEIVDKACTNCDFDGKELSTNTTTYNMDYCREVEFEVKDYPMLTNDFDVEMLIAKGMLKAQKELAENWAQTLVAHFNTNKGVNVATAAPGTGMGCISGSDTYITAPYWNADLMGYFSRVQQLNRFGNPYLLSGRNLHEAAIVANFKALNANEKDKQALFGSMPIHFDEVNVDAVNTPNYITYMIQPFTYAIANKSYYNPTPTEYFDQKRWSINADYIPGHTLDVHYTNTCDSANSDFFVHKFKIKHKAGVFQNPEACDDNNTGILTFICGDCPS